MAASYRALRPLYNAVVSFISVINSATISPPISFYIYILLFRGFLSGPHIYFLAIRGAVGAFINRNISNNEAVSGRVNRRVIRRIKDKIVKEVKGREGREYSKFIKICCGALLIILLIIYINLNFNRSLFINFLFFLGRPYPYIIYRGSLIAIRLPGIGVDNRSIY